MVRVVIFLLAFILVNSTSAQFKEIADSIYNSMSISHQNINPSKKLFKPSSAEVVDSTLHQEWVNEQWVNVHLHRHTYSSDLREHVNAHKIYKNNQWSDLDRRSFCYDDSGKKIWEKKEEYVNERWENISQDIVTYSSESYVWITQGWDKKWINTTRTTGIYEPGTDFLKEIIVEGGTDVWKNMSKFINTDDKVNRTQKTVHQLWRNEWNNNAQYIQVTNEDGSGKISSYFNWKNNDWQPEWQVLSKYDKNNILESVEQNWNNSTGWENSSRDLYIYYNGKSLVAEEIHQLWSYNENLWVNSYKNIFEYDDLSGEVKTIIWQEWENDSWVSTVRELYDSHSSRTKYKITQHRENGEWINRWIETDFYKLDDPNGDRTVLPAFTLEQNYPNPFNPGTTIKFFIKETQLVELKIYDMQGCEVAVLLNEEKPAGEYTLLFDGSSLASGVYFCKLKAGDYIETKKMILLK